MAVETTIAAGRAQCARPAGRRMPDGGGAPPPGHAVMTLPNAITFARLCAVPVAVWLVLHGDYRWAFWLFAAAGASDALDGWLARRRGTTQLGALMDPVADKALMVSMYVTLAVVGVLPDWLAMLVVFRDMVIVGGVMALSLTGHTVPIRPLRISKLNTALQVLLVAATLFLIGHGLGGRGANAAGLVDTAWAGLVLLVAASTLLSGCAYVWQSTVWQSGHPR